MGTRGRFGVRVAKHIGILPPMQIQIPKCRPDLAAILGAACSLKVVWIEDAGLETRLRLTEVLPGVDSVMEEILRIAIRFETWSCRNVDFEELNEVWPYYLEAEFGRACSEALDLQRLPAFGDPECAAIARVLGLPLRDVAV